MTQTIEFGMTAKDIVSGFEGIVVGKFDYLTRCTHYLLVPTVKDNKLIEGEAFDMRMIEVTNSEILETPKYSNAGKVKLGVTSRDVISGVEGIVIGVYSYIDGTVKAGIQPDKHTDSDKMTPGILVHAIHLEEVEGGRVVEPVPESNAFKPPPGGPSPNLKESY